MVSFMEDNADSEIYSNELKKQAGFGKDGEDVYKRQVLYCGSSGNSFHCGTQNQSFQSADGFRHPIQ